MKRSPGSLRGEVTQLSLVRQAVGQQIHSRLAEAKHGRRGLRSAPNEMDEAGGPLQQSDEVR